MEVPLLLPFLFSPCECAWWAVSALFTSSHHLYFLVFPNYSSFHTLSFSLPLSPPGSIPLPSSFYSHFRTPALPFSSSCLLSHHLPPVVLVCALVCHEGGGGWLVVGGLDGHLILALPHNVGMCDFFKIRFPRWVLSLAMVSTLLRVSQWSFCLSLCLCVSDVCLCQLFIWICSSFHGCRGGKKAAIVPKTRKPWQLFMLVNRWQSNVKLHSSKHALSDQTNRQIRGREKENDRRGELGTKVRIQVRHLSGLTSPFVNHRGHGSLKQPYRLCQTPLKVVCFKQLHFVKNFELYLKSAVFCHNVRFLKLLWERTSREAAQWKQFQWSVKGQSFGVDATYWLNVCGDTVFLA